jgi:hypothetical protein
MTMLRRLALAALVGAATSTLVAAQEAPKAGLPPARTVIARYVEAIGGREAIERTPSRWEQGRMEIASAGLSLRYELFAAPNRQFTRSEMPGLGEVRGGIDGEVAWLINPATGPMLLEGLALQQARQDADPLAPLHTDRYVAAAETVDDTEFGGARCWKVKVTTTWNEEYYEFFNEATGLLQGSIRSQATAQGSVEITTQVVDWRTVAGVRMPRVRHAQMMGAQVINTVDTTEVRAIPDSIFALPPEIRTLRGGR